MNLIKNILNNNTNFIIVKANVSNLVKITVLKLYLWNFLFKVIVEFRKLDVHKSYTIFYLLCNIFIHIYLIKPNIVYM